MITFCVNGGMYGQKIRKKNRIKYITYVVLKRPLKELLF